MGRQTFPHLSSACRRTALDRVTEFQGEAKEGEMEVGRRAVGLERTPDSATLIHMPLTHPDTLTFREHEEWEGGRECRASWWR